MFLKYFKRGGKNSNMFCSKFTRVKPKPNMFLMTLMHFLDKQEVYATKMQMKKGNYEQGKWLIIHIMKKLLSSGS